MFTPNQKGSDKMSPHVNGFVNDLVAMAKAMEELPQVQRELDEAKAEIERQRQHTQGLELNIAGYKADIEGLNERNHKLEAERDDAEMRFLELEEKHTSLTNVIKGVASGMGMVDKPAPQPVAEPVQATPEPKAAQDWQMDHTQGQSDINPTGAPTPSSGVTQQQETSGARSVESTSTEAPVVAASPPDPTAHSTAGDGPSSGDAQSASGTENASTSSDKPFAGKTWDQVHKDRYNLTDEQRRALYSKDGWREYGGTEEGWSH